ncbi:unnamed protein product [Danaus chrysippus]|uniref:(African queen) hypothetical protein n=1 Tax=Danaus chrysippus TaxID=151541 RepID=A0A8J2VYZ6_9NEOP|nr:unnamed protein product [Danaus chrysippus]
MVRLHILLLVVSSVLATVYSIDNDHLNGKENLKPDVKLLPSFLQRRRHQVPHEEIKEEDVGRYFRRPSRTTTVPSIFSMKVENKYQHVYPNVRPSDKQIHPKQNHTNADDPSVTSKPSTKNISTERVTLKTRNLSRRIPFAKRYKPAVVQPITSFNDHHQEEDKVETEIISTTTSTTTTSTTTSTTPEPVVLETTETEQRRKESVAASQNLESFTSKKIKDIMAEIQNSEELIEQKVTTTTSKPITTTIKKFEETEFVPPSINVPNITSHTRRRRPHFAKRVHMQPINESLTIKDDVALSTSAPIVDATTEAEQEKKTIPPSHVSDLPPNVKSPKPRRRPLNRDSQNRGSQKFRSDELRKQQTDTSLDEIHSTSTQEIPSTGNVPITTPKPPPVPTLSPWYDGYGK